MDDYTTEDVQQFRYTLNPMQQASVTRLALGGYFGPTPAPLDVTLNGPVDAGETPPPKKAKR